MEAGKSTITKYAKVVGIYINADDIKRTNHCSDLEAAKIAEELREESLEAGRDFSKESSILPMGKPVLERRKN